MAITLPILTSRQQIAFNIMTHPEVIKFLRAAGKKGGAATKGKVTPARIAACKKATQVRMAKKASSTKAPCRANESLDPSELA